MVMVGDREDDRAGAEAFGCAFVGLRRPDSDFRVPPRYAIDTLGDLPGVLSALGETGGA